MPNVSRSEPHEFDRVPRRGAVALVATVAGVAFLIGFQTPDDPGALGLGPGPIGALGPGTPVAAATPRPTRGATRPGNPTPAVTEPPPTAKPPSGPMVVDGPVVENPYGPVQVEITLQGRKLVDAQALELPTDRRLSREISDYVGPILRQEALRAQSANIDVITGATFTSEAYARSLQAALDTANP